MKVVQNHGKLVIFGDQLTVQCIETAIESRKESCCDFEGFRYIGGVRLGDFHLEMNATIKNIQRLMPTESSRDEHTLGYYSQRIAINHLVSNKPNKIKKVGNYEVHRRFLLTIGEEFLRNSLKTFFAEHIDRIEQIYKDDKNDAKELVGHLMLRFLEDYKLTL